ncbi:hypothetical protein EVAR_66337_1 [Eumeta japonica]|uniref:Uncharacterized protein n=1 Tax=Eumeta variegata TaxID=151549 RepID=A0A4C1YZ94_EUMVA|nr:hypothetical protein EVAR_66337_1 [Eumeta japonica]
MEDRIDGRVSGGVGHRNTHSLDEISTEAASSRPYSVRECGTAPVEPLHFYVATKIRRRTTTTTDHQHHGYTVTRAHPAFESGGSCIVEVRSEEALIRSRRQDKTQPKGDHDSYDRTPQIRPCIVTDRKNIAVAADRSSYCFQITGFPWNNQSMNFSADLKFDIDVSYKAYNKHTVTANAIASEAVHEITVNKAGTFYRCTQANESPLGFLKRGAVGGGATPPFLFASRPRSGSADDRRCADALTAAGTDGLTYSPTCGANGLVRLLNLFVDELTHYQGSNHSDSEQREDDNHSITTALALIFVHPCNLCSS